jgi:hypothetical protein
MVYPYLLERRMTAQRHCSGELVFSAPSFVCFGDVARLITSGTNLGQSDDKARPK